MKKINKPIRVLALAMLLLGGVGVSGCSTGTKDGEVSVEKSDAKDKDPTEHNENAEAQGQPSIDTSTMENMEKPYEETNNARDRDADRMADQPGTKSEHKGLNDRQDR
jgi:hypothetical protein